MLNIHPTETEEGFIKLFTTTLEVTKKTEPWESSEAESTPKLTSGPESEIQEDEQENHQSCPVFKNLRQLLRVCSMLCSFFYYISI